MGRKNENTLDLLLSRATKETEVSEMKLTTETLGEVIVKIPPFRKIAELIDEVSDENIGMYEAMLANAQLVYDSVPALNQNYAELSEAYDEKDPRALTIKIFEVAQALGELNDIAEKIQDSYGAYKEAVKN